MLILGNKAKFSFSTTASLGRDYFWLGTQKIALQRIIWRVSPMKNQIMIRNS